MTRHKLSLEEQLEGVKNALKSRRTPPQLREGLRRREAELEGQLQIGQSFLDKLFGVQRGGNKMARTNRIFTSFAIEDKWAKEYLVGQARNNKTPFSFTDMSIKQPFDEKWKTQCRVVIKGCDGVIALLSKNTARADGARWEMQCAVEERIPIIGVHTDAKNKGAVPYELNGKRVIEWSWDGITRFLDSL